jgi:class 3 adenylate cyclase
VTLLSKAALQHRGTIIKTIGDEILCTFADANDAVAAAKLMHRAVGKLPPIN